MLQICESFQEFTLKEGIEGVQVEWPGHILMVRLGGFQGGGQEWGVGLGGTHT